MIKIKNFALPIVIFLFNFQNMNAQNDSIEEIKKTDAKFIFNLGYSFITGLKGGVLFKVKNKFYGEVDYGYSMLSNQGPNGYSETRNKYLMGINFYPFKNNFTVFNFSFVYLNYKRIDGKVESILLSPNIGSVPMFHSKNNKGFNAIGKIGLFYILKKYNNDTSYHPGYATIIPSHVLPNIEFSFSYGF